ncbi:hypothetical protein HY68_01605 [Streptomyces sp. AcH 505]|uniref:hypothetical protein n=1 Tax=Streptomyces sp. AcH 505 TaxID=352211 RepID=UPI00059224AF|nr:hypothetical protein HY68_01605 [Streptomyces sp. AcH 505]
MESISSLSLEFVQAEVTATRRGVPYNPTDDVVAFAFTAIGTSRPDTWYTGGWDGDDPIPGTHSYRAQVLVGPAGSGPALAVGRYQMWIRISDSPEVPVLPVGQLAIT